MRAVMIRAAHSLAAILALYLAAAVVLGLIPVNRDWQLTDGRVLVYLRTNGIHAEIAVPLRTDGIDWATELYEPFVTYGGIKPGYVSFGFGDRMFYVGTRSWADARPLGVATALLGLNGAVIHVEHVPGPSTDLGHRPIWLDTEQYRRLAAHIRGGFARTPSGLVILATDDSFGRGDRFYVANGAYGPFLTCNEWVRRALATAGVRTAAWSPFDTALFWWAR
jgi:uncharacterized protein (TIGR02117 family)